MKTLLHLIFICFLTVSCQKQTSQEKPWFKGNLHTHSYWSDDDECLEVIVGWHKSNGYHFVALSDHNTLAGGEKWIHIPEKNHLQQKEFLNYLKTYGEDWVNYKRREDSSIHVLLKPFRSYRKRHEEDGKFFIIQSEEISDWYDKKPIHLNASNLQKHIGRK